MKLKIVEEYNNDGKEIKSVTINYKDIKNEFNRVSINKRLPMYWAVIKDDNSTIKEDKELMKEFEELKKCSCIYEKITSGSSSSSSGSPSSSTSDPSLSSSGSPFPSSSGSPSSSSSGIPSSVLEEPSDNFNKIINKLFKRYSDTNEIKYTDENFQDFVKNGYNKINNTNFQVYKDNNPKYKFKFTEIEDKGNETLKRYLIKSEYEKFGFNNEALFGKKKSKKKKLKKKSKRKSKKFHFGIFG